MTDTYLIAHKVRGEAAFDIAEHLACPECSEGCPECDGDGFWWIVSTSGHRAYPYWSELLHNFKIELDREAHFVTLQILDRLVPEMPESLPDHYPTRQAKAEPSSGKSLLASLGLLPKVQRRL